MVFNGDDVCIQTGQQMKATAQGAVDSVMNATGMKKWSEAPHNSSDQ